MPQNKDLTTCGAALRPRRRCPRLSSFACLAWHSQLMVWMRAFSRMRSKGSRFTLRVWGLSCVRQTLRNSSQPFATVHNRPREDHMAVPMVSSAKGFTFRAVQRHIASFRVAGEALCDIPTCCMTWPRSLCVAGAILLLRFRRCVACFVAGAALWRPPMSFSRGRRSTLDVSCCCFFFGGGHRNVSAARSGDTVQILWQAWHFVTRVENRWKPCTKRRFRGSFVRKGKRRFWSCEWWNLRKSRTKCAFWCSNMSRLELLASVVQSQCLCGKKTCPRWMFQNRLSCLRGRRDTSWHSNMFHQKSFFCGTRSTLETSEVILRGQVHHFRHVVLRVFCELHCQGCPMWWHSPLHTLHFTLHTLHSTLYNLNSNLHTLHFTLHTFNFTLNTPHFPLYTPHPTLDTRHFTLYTCHSTLHTLHPTLYIPHSTLYTLHPSLYTPLFTLPHCNQHSTVLTLHFPHHTLHFTLSTPLLTLYTPHFTLSAPHPTLYIPHLALYTKHSTLHTLHFTLHTCTLHSTLYTSHFTLYTFRSTPQT